MGGCRCSYRNCKVRSDGQTHMFHFPVFDKMRCHQWITNSHKPNFLNLKLSQLKNRVICQHHFREDNFMNFLRDKLKSDAVPTEDGPFCVADHIKPMFEENDNPAIPINVDDIENEQMNSLEKKAHSSVKYGDFLISDVTELFNSSIDSQKVIPKSHVKHKMLNMGGLDAKYILPNPEEIHNYTIIYSTDEQTKPESTLSFYKTAPNPELVGIDYEEPKINELFNATGQLKTLESSNSALHQRSIAQEINPDKIVKILSEKTISEPVVVQGELQPISPSMIIRRPIRKKQSGPVSLKTCWDMKPQLINEGGCINIDLNSSNNNARPIQQTILFEQTVPVEFESKDFKSINENNPNVVHVNMNNQSQVDNIENLNNFNNVVLNQKEIPLEQAFSNCKLENQAKIKEAEFVPKSKEKQPIITPISTPVYKSILKSKITPEKLAAIEQKRKFNMKLRDVITSCLDNIDEQNEVTRKKLSPEKRQTVKRNLHSRAPSPVSTQGGVVAYLEARLQRMEDTLLNKIDLNTQRINELKRTIKPAKNARHANTQTHLVHMSEESELKRKIKPAKKALNAKTQTETLLLSEEYQKKILYKEISKFLSPDANIKVYEELFLGKTSQDVTETSTPRKLRRKR